MSYIKPQDQVQDNVTDRAPTQNAVYDAIAAAVPNPTIPADADKVLSVNSSGIKSWNYAGLGAGALGTGNVVLGRSKPTNLTGTNNTIMGVNAANSLSTASDNIFIGKDSAIGVTTGIRNVTIGVEAGQSVNPQEHVVIGYQAGKDVSFGVAIGTYALNVAGGGQNTAIGYAAGYQANITGQNNILLGWCSGYSAITGGASLTSGANNSFLGAATGPIDATTSHSIALGAYSLAASNEFAAGSSTSQINTMLLGRGGANQTVANAVKIMTMRASGTNTDLSAGTLTLAGSQSTGDKSGGDVIIATAPAGSSGSSLNAHVERMRVTASGNVGIGTSSPSVKLQVDSGVSDNILQLASNGYSYTLSRNNSNGNLTFTGSQTGNVGYTFSSPGGDRLTIAGNGDVTVSENFTVTKQSTLTGITGIGTTPITNVGLTVSGATNGDQLRILQSAGFGYKFGRESSGGLLQIDGTQAGFIGYQFLENGVDVFRIDSVGSVIINETGTSTADVRIEGDTDANLLFTDASADKVGIGTATPAEKLEVNGNVKVSSGDISIATAGKGLSVKEGTNAKIGVTGAFPGGGTNTVTVSTTAVTSNSIIFISAVSGATTIDPKIWISTITAGTSFVISSGDNSFTGTVGWMIVERLP